MEASILIVQAIVAAIELLKASVEILVLLGGLVLQICGCLIPLLALTLGVSGYFQARQLYKGQNTFKVIEFLQATDVRKARTRVRSELKDLEYPKEWNKDKDAIEQADMVISTFDVAGSLAREDMILMDMIIDQYAPSIIDCFMILKPRILEMQATSGKTYWDDFSWLFNKAKAKYPNLWQSLSIDSE